MRGCSSGALRRAMIILATFCYLMPGVASSNGRANGKNHEYRIIPQEDEIPWKFAHQKRVIAIGDIHADLNALIAILQDRKLINSQGKWIGKDTHLVLMGDLIGKHTQSKPVMDFVMELEKQAEASGGKVHALIGNNEFKVTAGDLHSMNEKDLKFFDAIADNGLSPEEAARRAFQADSKYAEWIRSRNAMVQIGDTLYVHGGLDRWMLEKDVTPGTLNATVRSWLKHFQGFPEIIADREGTSWTVGYDLDKGFVTEQGPLFHRGFGVEVDNKGELISKRNPEGPKLKKLKEVCERLGIKRIVVGHAPIPIERILLEHPYYGDLLLMIDTAISKGVKGKLSALEILFNEKTLETEIIAHNDIERPRSALQYMRNALSAINNKDDCPKPLQKIIRKILLENK